MKSTLRRSNIDPYCLMSFYSLDDEEQNHVSVLDNNFRWLRTIKFFKSLPLEKKIIFCIWHLVGSDCRSIDSVFIQNDFCFVKNIVETYFSTVQIHQIYSDLVSLRYRHSQWQSFEDRLWTRFRWTRWETQNGDGEMIVLIPSMKKKEKEIEEGLSKVCVSDSAVNNRITGT